ncbi:117aa long hypothetical protein [Pyrococcus horikoshii OT3]|uniref:Uncharacterized protein n=1 Tax=Pyrococcus horikoshii (strain ATCC 700860 / DSM 12428 / JCM 9974 / NBRC 100139 / OT-3) TaxID=70601 RepID=O58568_PYRHO|nr:117aa long hypothetical protein [Pyrococcus horikoshii OT3]
MGKPFIDPGKPPVWMYFSKSLMTLLPSSLCFFSPITLAYSGKERGITSKVLPPPLLPGNNSMSLLTRSELEPVTVITSFSKSPESIRGLTPLHHPSSEEASSRKMYPVFIPSSFFNS